MLKINYDYKSNNCNERSPSAIIDTIILHFTEVSFDQALKILCDPEKKVSSHYLIHKNGTIYNLVDEEKQAWHAGKSYWKGRESLNDYSIGIELDNNGHEEYTKNLMHSLILLCNHLIKQHDIKPHNIIGHSDIAPDRKVDPGRLFDWEVLANNKIGLHHNLKLDNPRPYENIEEVQELLNNMGYKISITGIFDNQTQNVVKAFSDHWYKNNIHNQIDFNLYNILKCLTHTNKDIDL
jgi:N-acetylmuramoyl-L-alanine amidase